MKKFIFTILTVSVFFVGLGGLVESAGAKFKSDDKALTIIALSRQAIGGDTAIKNVRSLSVKGATSQTLNFDGVPRVEQGEMEIALQLPNKFVKTLKIGHDDAGNVSFSRQVNQTMIVRKDGETSETAPGVEEGEQKILVRTKDGDNHFFVKSDEPENAGDPADRKIRKIIVDHQGSGNPSQFRQNELLRTSFSLLLSAPEGTDVNYTYAGENNVDGNSCDVILAQSGGSSFKLFIDQSSHLPIMMSYQGFAPMAFKVTTDAPTSKPVDSPDAKAMVIMKDGQPETGGKTFRVFTRAAPVPEATAEIQIKFSDYRSTGGVQLPYKWTQTTDGKPDQNVDVTSYEINPANIEEKFQNVDQKMIIRTKKPE